MNVTENMLNNISHIILEGRFDSDTSAIVEKIIREKIEKGVYRFILDMEKVLFVASAGLRVILVIAKDLRQHHGDLYIASLQTNVRRVFEISGLDNALHIFEDAEAAARNFDE